MSGRSVLLDEEKQMERKAGTGTVAVTREEVRAALTKARTLASDEEKTLRMRYGVGAESHAAPLPRAAAGNAELEDELLIIEMQLMKAWKARMAADKAPRARTGATTTSSRTKDKIVRALRRKK